MSRIRPYAAFLSECDAYDTNDAIDLRMLQAFWDNPAPFLAEQAAMRAKCNAHFDAVRDAGLRRAGLI